MCGWHLNGSPASKPARSIIRANPAVVKGPARSLVKTNGDLGSCSRCKRRKARSSSPMIGWVLGVPCLTPRTCRVAVAKSIWSHRRSTSSDTRKPCRHATVHQAPTRHAEVQGTEWRPVASRNQVLGYRSLPTEGNTRNGLDWTTRFSAIASAIDYAARRLSTVRWLSSMKDGPISQNCKPNRSRQTGPAILLRLRPSAA
jgi:hypothetical protein